VTLVRYSGVNQRAVVAEEISATPALGFNGSPSIFVPHAREVALGLDYWIAPAIVWQTEVDFEVPHAGGTVFSFNGGSTPTASSVGATPTTARSLPNSRSVSKARRRPAMTTLSKSIVIRLPAIVLLALGATTALAAESEQQQREMFRLGARLWPVYCAQCHNARPGSEFSPPQWDVIMMHMRTQANLTANDARALTEYLKRSH